MSLIEEGLVSAGLVQSGLVGAISSTLIRVLRRRFFRRNEGTTDFISIPEITLVGDFDIRFLYLPELGGGDSRVLGRVATPDGRIVYQPTTDDITINTATETILFTNVGMVIDFLNEVAISRVGTTYTSIVNGVKVEATGVAFDLTLSSILAGNAFQHVVGIMADVKLSMSSTLKRSYAIDDDNDTIKDSIGGFDGTVINGNPDDRGLFEEISGGWRGQGLEVPPWDSVDQELIRA